MSFPHLSTPSPHQSTLPSPLQPSPIPDSYTAAPTHDDPPITDHEPQDPAPLPPPPHFFPYFTLLTNPTSTTTHHPTVQYIFADDTPDNDPITSAALRVLDANKSAATMTAAAGKKRSDGQDDVRERFVLVDMDATGTKVMSAQSMSPDWAVTGTELGPAPTWDRDGQGVVEEGAEGEGEGEERGLMLRIEGVEVLGGIGGGVKVDGKGKGKVGEGGDEEEKRLEELVDVYERRMGELRRVVNAGAGVGIEERRRRA